MSAKTQMVSSQSEAGLHSCHCVGVFVRWWCSGPRQERAKKEGELYLGMDSKFMIMSAMKRPIMPKQPPLAPTTISQPFSQTALKKLPAQHECCAQGWQGEARYS